MKLYLSLLAAFLVLTNAAFGGVGDVGVSDGYNLQPSSSYLAGAAQPGGLAPQTPGSQGQGNLMGNPVYSAPQESPLQPSGIQVPVMAAQPLGLQQSSIGSNPDQSSQSAQLGYPQAASFPLNQGGYVPGQNYQSPQVSYPYVSQPSQGKLSSSYLQSSSYPQASPVSQMSAFTSEAPQLSGPYQEHFSPDDLRLSQPSAEGFKPEGSLNFATASPPSGILNDATSSAVSGEVPGSGSWYYPGSVSSRNRFYAQTSSGLQTVAGCNQGGYVPIWANIASSDNFYVYEWYPGQTSPYVRWWCWTWPGWKKGWFSGDVPGWHILCYHCRDSSNYIYIYVWPGAGAVGATGNSYSGYAQGSQSQPPVTGALPSGAPTPPDPNAENLMLPDLNLVSQGQSGNQVPGGYGPVQGGYGSQSGYPAQTFNTVFPKPTAYRCNEYYVQTMPGRLNTVGSVKCGQWLPLWSKIGKPGCYWSFEWTQGCTSSGSFCYPEVKNFGYKGTGWYSTWFRGDKPGWHVLCYNCNDWSNYVYVYVWSN